MNDPNCSCGCERTVAYKCWTCRKDFNETCVVHIERRYGHREHYCHSCYAETSYTEIISHSSVLWRPCCKGVVCSCGCLRLATTVCRLCSHPFMRSCMHVDPDADWWEASCSRCYRIGWPSHWMREQWKDCCMLEFFAFVSLARLFILMPNKKQKS